MRNFSQSRPRKNRFQQFFVILVLLYGLLLIPDTKESPIYEAKGIPFAWNRDQTWQQLEQSFKEAKQLQPAILDSMITRMSVEAEDHLAGLRDADFGPRDE
ncbi:MAG: hypothetical protein ACR2MX_12980, partial [Cyclobacteriaceae bacterium]